MSVWENCVNAEICWLRGVKTAQVRRRVISALFGMRQEEMSAHMYPRLQLGLRAQAAVWAAEGEHQPARHAVREPADEKGER